jgi:LysM repeat protein
MSMKRIFISANILVILSLFWAGCQTFGDMSKREEERQLRRLMRGSLDESGMYLNEHYQFRVRLPEGWPGDVGDPPEVLIVHPSSHHISRSSLRRQVTIRVNIWTREAGEGVIEFIERYSDVNQYEQVLQRPSMVEGFVSGRILFYAEKDGKPFRVMSLFVMKENEFVVVECSAPRDVYDNFESSFRTCLDSYESTREDLPELPDPNVTDVRSDPDAEHFDYTVAPGETLELLATLFLGHSERVWMLADLNEIDSVQAGQRILIPRTMRYEVNSRDTWRAISRRIFATGEYADTIRNFNNDIDLVAGTEVYIPLYYEETPVMGESYSDAAVRLYNDASLAKRLLDYNDLEPLGSLKKLKVPIYLKERYYIYTVQRGDSLAWIARWLTGDSSNYKQIADYNNIASPYRVIVNQQIKIPAYLVPDPGVFDRPLPRPTPRAATPSTPQPTVTPRHVSTPTPTPRPITDPGIFDIE